MIAAQAVHTTGVNWESVAAIAAVLAVFVSVMTWWLARRDRKSQQENREIKDEISLAVNHLGERLEAKLETKETVARISERLARLEGAAGMMNNVQGERKT